MSFFCNQQIDFFKVEGSRKQKIVLHRKFNKLFLTVYLPLPLVLLELVLTCTANRRPTV